MLDTLPVLFVHLVACGMDSGNIAVFAFSHRKFALVAVDSLPVVVTVSYAVLVYSGRVNGNPLRSMGLLIRCSLDICS